MNMPAKAAKTEPTTQATIEAMLFSLRRGLACLTDPAILDRLRRCDNAAMKEITAQLESWKSKNKPWLPAWTDDDIMTLIKTWREGQYGS